MTPHWPISVRRNVDYQYKGNHRIQSHRRSRKPPVAYGEHTMVLLEQLLRLTVSGEQERAFSIRQAVIAGWTGRDPVALETHIRELEELGVTRPSATPIFYRVSANRGGDECGDRSQR
jgi:hypothetical protein